MHSVRPMLSTSSWVGGRMVRGTGDRGYGRTTQDSPARLGRRAAGRPRRAPPAIKTFAATILVRSPDRRDTMSALPNITEADIRARVGDTSFERGEEYFASGAIFDPRKQGRTLKA